MTTMRYPRLRYQSERGWLVASDALLMCFYIRHPHKQIAPAVMRALELFRERIHPYRITRYVGDGQTEPLDDSAWEKIRQEILGPNDAALVQMEDDSRWTGKLFVDYRGLPVVPLPWKWREDDVSVLYLRLPTEYLEAQGPERVRALAIDLAQELPFSSGYTDFVLCEASWTMGKAIDLVRPRYPGVEVAPSSANLGMNTWVDGVHWMNFLGQPVLGQLGGMAGLREHLALPGISLLEMSGDRVLITLGERPEPGDVEAGQTLPLHRALARILEPHLHHRRAERTCLSPEELLRWECRFLD
ncbi:type VI immunity family protein [Archangium sp.]|uniref:type VI immunity family protein n=1 Tax=Archangium sp. TaxID=1872627 RepID=UPI002D46A18D|nr:type VI immunity family protein [Archangium sp.]HYO51227.1 type VI immunity family protein [Archangium sp.]